MFQMLAQTFPEKWRSLLICAKGKIFLKFPICILSRQIKYILQEFCLFIFLKVFSLSCSVRSIDFEKTFLCSFCCLFWLPLSWIEEVFFSCFHVVAHFGQAGTEKTDLLKTFFYDFRSINKKSLFNFFFIEISLVSMCLVFHILTYFEKMPAFQDAKV